MKIITFFFQMTIFGNVMIQTARSTKSSEILCSIFSQKNQTYYLLSNGRGMNAEIIQVKNLHFSEQAGLLSQ